MAIIDLHYHGVQEAVCDWQEAENSDPAFYMQGGERGLVLSKKPSGSYTTAFVEVFTNEMFIRGEGATLVEAEQDAYKKWVQYTSCKEHEYEPRGYHNGGGFCKNCQRFKGKAFTPEQLGAYCSTCGTASYWSYDNVSEKYGCKDHPIKNQSPGPLEELFTALSENTEDKED